MALGRVPGYTLLLVGACCAGLLGKNAAELLPDPQVWHTESPSSEINGLAYDAAAEILYEVGFRYTDIDTGEYLGSKFYFMRGIDVATGNTTFLMQNGSDQTDAFHGERASGMQQVYSFRTFGGRICIDYWYRLWFENG